MADIEEVMNEEEFDEEDAVIELEDEEGNVTRFVFIDSVEHNGTTYYALIPEDSLSDDESSESDEFVVLKEAEVDGNLMLVTVDDDDEYNAVGEIFLDRFGNFDEE